MSILSCLERKADPDEYRQYDSIAVPPGQSISVIVPVYNGGLDFEKCLLQLLHTTPPPSEIIVVGDGDTDGSTQRAAALGVRVLRLAIRGGPARARNVGARAARGEILFFVDADVLVHADVMAQVSAAFSPDEPDIVATFGRYDDRPAASNFLSQYKNLLHHYVHSTASEEASTFWGACGAMRRDVFMSLGGFDENYDRPCIEDIELGYRIKGAGYRIRLHKALQVTHLKRWSAISLLKTDFYQRALPWTALILRDNRFVNDLNVNIASRISVVAIYGLLGIMVVMAAGWRSSMSGVHLLVAGVLMGLLLVLNRGIYGFFRHERGLWFAARAIPWHWLYFLYSGLAFAIAWTHHTAADRPAYPGRRVHGNGVHPAD